MMILRLAHKVVGSDLSDRKFNSFDLHFTWGTTRVVEHIITDIPAFQLRQTKKLHTNERISSTVLKRFILVNLNYVGRREELII